MLAKLFLQYALAAVFGIDGARLGLGAARSGPVKADGKGSLTVPVERHGFRLVVVEQSQHK